MKKLFFIAVAIILGANIFAQVTLNPENYDSVNYREHEDRYLLPEFIQDSLGLLDVFYIKNDVVWQYNNGTVNRTYLMNHTSIVDIAQPYYSDSILTVTGVSILFYSAQYGQMIPYACIADSNFNIQRKVAVPSYFDDKQTKYAYPNTTNYCRYMELFFDSSINIKGKFYVMLDNPKPYPYTEYNWNKEELFDRMQISSAIPVIDYTNYSNYSSTNNPYLYDAQCKTFAIGEDRDSVLFEYQWKKLTDYWANHLFVYMFPIFKDFDASSEYMYPNTSSIEQVLDNYTHVFPNPTSDNVIVQCSYKIQQLEIINSLGQVLETRKANAYSANIDVNRYDKGNYFVKITTKSGTATKKIIIQ